MWWFFVSLGTEFDILVNDSEKKSLFCKVQGISSLEDWWVQMFLIQSAIASFQAGITLLKS